MVPEVLILKLPS